MRTIRLICSILGTFILSGALVASAGSLTPSASPGATMKSLQDLYDPLAGTYNSSSVSASTTGNLLQQLKYLTNNLGWSVSGVNVTTAVSGAEVGIGVSDPTAALHLKAGTATLAPLKFTSGTNLTTPSAGALEFDGTSLTFTPSATRRTVAFTDTPSFTALTSLTFSNTDPSIAVGNSGTLSITDGTNTLFSVADNGTTGTLTVTGTLTSGAHTFSAAATDLTTGTNEALTIAPNGTGDTIFNTDADTNVQITATAGPGDTLDLLAITNTGQGSANSYDLLDLTLVVGSGDSAVDTNNAIRLTVPSPAEAGDIARGIQVDGTTATAGTEIGVNIANITAGSGTETAISIGSGWDTDLAFVDTTPTMTIGNAGTLSITDGTNTLFSIADAGTTGNATVTGTLTSGAFTISGAATDLTTGTNEALTIAPNGTGDTIVNTDADTNVQIVPTAQLGVDAFTISNSGLGFTAALSDGIDLIDLTFTSPTATSAASTNSVIRMTMSTPADSDDIARGITIAASGAAQGIVDAINISSIGGGGATERALAIGDGWDTGLLVSDTTTEISLTSTSPTLSIGNTGTLSFTDGTNTLLSIADAGTTGNVTITGTLTSGAFTISGAATDLTTGTNEALTIAPNGTGDTIVNTDADSNVQITATAAPGVDMVAISNAGQVVTTTGVDAMEITLAQGAAGAGVVNNALNLTLSSTATAAAILRAVNVSNFTQPEGTSLDVTAFQVGTGFDWGLYFASTEAGFKHIGISNTGTLRITDEDANNLLTIADAGTTGNVSVTGNVTGGSAVTSGTTTLDIGGTTTTNGLCHASASGTDNEGIVDCSGAPSDIAEWYETASDVGAGDLVVPSNTRLTYRGIILNKNNAVLPGEEETISVMEKSSQPYAPNLIGVVSTAPFQTFGENILERAKHPMPVALSGRVPVKVTARNGAIRVGDRLTSSDIPGVAMRATTSGPTIGIALGEYAGPDVGKVIVFLNLGWAKLDGAAIAATSGQPLPIRVDANGRMTLAGDLDVGGRTLSNVGAIASATSRFSLDERGRLVVDEVEVRQRLILHDEVTGDRYCVRMRNGALTQEPCAD